jgi:pimeloyl-ACP methyl ester carboxylesterase
MSYPPLLDVYPCLVLYAMRNHLSLPAGLVALLALATCQSQPDRTTPAAESPGAGEWVGTGPQHLWAQVYPSAQLSAHPALLVVLHGDAPFNKPDYQYALARQVAQATPNVVVVALLRPGYTDPAGHQSAGERGEATGDNYTPAVLDALAGALATLRARYHAGRVVLAGHSGGAALAADLLGRRPGLADAALLASCPCNVATWRAHMKRRQGGAIWDQAVASVSPEQVVARIPGRTRVTLLVGTADSIAPPALTLEYYRRLQQLGIPVKLHELPGLGHEVFLGKAVKEEIKALLQ